MMRTMATGLNSPSASTRRSARVEVQEIVYVNWPCEPAFILNLSDLGMGIQAMEVLEPGRSLSLAFPLPNSDGEIQGLARIVWADPSGRAGLEFLSVTEFDRLRLQRWMKGREN